MHMSKAVSGQPARVMFNSTTAAPPPKMNAVDAVDLIIGYDVESPIFDGLNLGIGRGEFVCITGPSGCGKSTLIRAISGLLRLDGGSIRSYGRSVTGPAPTRMMVFQEDSTFPWLTVRENVEFGLMVSGMEEDERHILSEKYLDMVHMLEFADRHVRRLSVGQRQRVSIARALVLNPDMLLMDEPFSALDVKTKNRLMLEVQHIWQETEQTILFVTHDPLEAAALGTRVIRLAHPPDGIASDVQNNIPYPRSTDDPVVVELAAGIKRAIVM